MYWVSSTRMFHYSSLNTHGCLGGVSDNLSKFGRERSRLDLIVPLLDPSQGADGVEVLVKELARLEILALQVSATFVVHEISPAVPAKNRESSEYRIRVHRPTGTQGQVHLTWSGCSWGTEDRTGWFATRRWPWVSFRRPYRRDRSFSRVPRFLPRS